MHSFKSCNWLTGDHYIFTSTCIGVLWSLFPVCYSMEWMSLMLIISNHTSRNLKDAESFETDCLILLEYSGLLEQEHINVPGNFVKVWKELFLKFWRSLQSCSKAQSAEKFVHLPWTTCLKYFFVLRFQLANRQTYFIAQFVLKYYTDILDTQVPWLVVCTMSCAV